MRVLTPEEFERVLTNVPAEHRAMVLLAAETGLSGATSSPCDPTTSTRGP